MSLPYSPSKAVFLGNGVTVDFPFDFKVWKDANLEVKITDPKGVVQTVAGWTTTITDNGGTITYRKDGAPLPTGWRLTILRNMPFTQVVDLISGTQFDPQVIEEQLDQATAERQQLLEGLNRSVKVDPSAEHSPEDLIHSIYEARDAAAGSSSDAAESAAKSAASALQSLGSAAESLASAMRACACADRSEQARDVVLEQVALVNQLMAVEMGKINTLIAANKDDHLAAIAQALAWAITPHNVPVRMHPETNEPEFSALHWAEVARRAGLKEATMLKFGIVRLASALDVKQGHPTAVVTAVQLKERTSPATEEEFGVVRLATAADFASGATGDNGSAVVTVDALFEAFINNRICQYEWFEDDMPRAGFFSCLGGVVTNFAAKYPKAAAYFETSYGQKRLVTQAEYDALHVYSWHTNSDGSKVGWNGIGGVAKFVWDKQADTLRLPDLAGMTPEQVGFSDSLGVGGVRGDMIRNIRGSMQRSPQPDAGYIYIDSHLVGAFAIDKTSELSSTTMAGTKAGTFPTRMIFEPSRVVPTGPRNHGPRYISDARVYLGQPVL